jgi:hypothetical protein
MASSDHNQFMTSKELEKLKVKDLKKILVDEGQRVTGKKANLVLRCRVLLENKSSNIQDNSLPDSSLLASSSCPKKINDDVTYERFEAETMSCSWSTDLRGLPPFNFIQYASNMQTVSLTTAAVS